VEGLTEPVDPAVAAALREAVRSHARSERRRVFAPVLHVGTPGAHAHVELRAPTDPGTRVDVVAALRVAAYGVEVARGEEPVPGLELCWLTRPAREPAYDGPWLAAARAAYAEAGAALVFAVVTRHGWRDPRSGVAREWARVR
jgi:hypothetical protein